MHHREICRQLRLVYVGVRVPAVEATIMGLLELGLVTVAGDGHPVRPPPLAQTNRGYCCANDNVTRRPRGAVERIGDHAAQ